jgi:hypothetical protein
MVTYALCVVRNEIVQTLVMSLMKSSLAIRHFSSSKATSFLVIISDVIVLTHIV